MVCPTPLVLFNRDCIKMRRGHLQVNYTSINSPKHERGIGGCAKKLLAKESKGLTTEV